jgi:hypothetical protein
MLLRAAILVAGLIPSPPSVLRVPLPPRYVIIHAACPDRDGLGLSCAYYDGRVYLAPGASDFAFWHELGHVFDAEVMTEGDRRWFMRRLSTRTTWWSRGPGDRSPSELFADAYGICALGLHPDGGEWIDAYGYEPGRKRHRQICAAIGRVGERHAAITRRARAS